MWDVATRRLAATLAAAYAGVYSAFRPDGRMLAVANSDGTASLG
jgi:hypothetical protein